MEKSSKQKPIHPKLQFSFKNALVYNLGCPKNLVDSERLCSLLTIKGIKIHKTFDSVIDSIWVNSCCFIQSAREETITTIKQYASCANAKVIVFGCYANRYPHELRNLFPEMIIIDEKDPIAYLSTIWDGSPTDPIQRNLSNPFSAYLKIADGCDRACSFCIIPSIKGPYFSIPIHHLLQEVKTLCHQYPIKELNIIAQDTSRYGNDIKPTSLNLIDLVSQISDNYDIPWIRVMYLFPSLEFDFIDQLLSIPRVVPYLDMPMQHVSPKILSLMNRPNNFEQTVQTLQKLRKKHPDLALRSTFIVGFPGETHNDFERLCEFLNDFRFERCGFFAYSDENDAPSYHLPDKVPSDIAQERLHKAYQIQHDIQKVNNKKFIGCQIPVLIERWNGIKKELIGRTVWDAPEIDQEVVITNLSPRFSQKKGDILPVTIINSDACVMEGSLS